MTRKRKKTRTDVDPIEPRVWKVVSHIDDPTRREKGRRDKWWVQDPEKRQKEGKKNDDDSPHSCACAQI